MIRKESFNYILNDWTPEILEVMLPLMAELITIDLENEPLKKVSSDSCNMSYFTKRGWIITAFNDCGGWDYIDDAMSPDGKSLCKQLGVTYLGGLGDFYEPSKDQLDHIWVDWNEY